MVVVSMPSQPSYEELAAVVVALQARIVELEAALRQNSSNSSRPPSSDSPFVKPAPKSLRGKSGRRSGGQPGHGSGYFPGSPLTVDERAGIGLEPEPAFRGPVPPHEQPHAVEA